MTPFCDPAKAPQSIFPKTPGDGLELEFVFEVAPLLVVVVGRDSLNTLFKRLKKNGAQLSFRKINKTQKKVYEVKIHKETRSWDKPSDHVPIEIIIET